MPHDDARRRSGGDGRVAFCFGVARRTALPGPVLVRMLADLGVTPSAARTRLARLVAGGSLTTTRRGRTADYRLAGAFAVAYARAEGLASPAPTWDGELHGLLVTVAERHRPFRDAFRRQAGLAGYGQLQPGLFVAPDDRSAPLAELLARAPEGASVLPARLRFDPDAGRAAAAQAWDLDRLAAAYRDRTAAVRAALAVHADAPPSTVLAAYAGVVEAAFGLFARDPGLPEALLPAHWPRAALAAAVTGATTTLGPVCEAYVADLLAST